MFLVLTKDASGLVRRQNLAEFCGLLRERDMISFSLFYGVTFGGFVGFASFLSSRNGSACGLTSTDASKCGPRSRPSSLPRRFEAR